MKTAGKSITAFTLGWLTILSTHIACADFKVLWTVGEKNHNMEEFEKSNNGKRDSEPGSASSLDDHYYVSGSYPAPIGTVFQDEGRENFEPRIVSGDSRIRIYFPPPASDPTFSRYTLTFRTIWNGYWIPSENDSGETPGNHFFAVRCNGVDVTETLLAPYLIDTNEFSVSFGGQALDPDGFNYIEIEHLGGTIPDGSPFPSSFWANLDYVSLMAHPTGMLDSDNDNLPLYWESQYHLSDDDAQDASSDLDSDGLTAAQEFAIGTSPLNPDTDNDGLSDSEETVSNPLVRDTDQDGLLDGQETNSNPQLADTDGDGASDSLETFLGTDPSDPANTPPLFSGSIGINFVHQSNLQSLLQTDAATGVLPQINWNQTRGLEWGDKTGDQNLIRLPIRGTLVDASGAATGTTISWSGHNPRLLYNYGEDPDLPAHRLYKGSLAAHSSGSNSEDLTLNLGNIPYSDYDLVLYLHTDSKDPDGHITLNDDSDTVRVFSNLEFEVLDGFKESLVYGEGKIRRGNYLRFKDLSGSSLQIRLESDTWFVGIVALQVINMGSDMDNDTLPDSWEREHGLDLTRNTDGALDADGDGLSNAGEFALRTDPNHKDTDGDGLLDGVETNTRSFVSLENTGTDPLNPDTDLDGLSDYFEITNSGFRSNPNEADSDHDGTPDGTEVEWKSDPYDKDSKILPTPSYNAAQQELTWAIENMRLRFDYSKGRELSNWGGGSVIEFRILNGTEAAGRWATINMQLEYNDGSLGYNINFDRVGSFNRAGEGNGFSLAHWSWNRGPTRPQDISQGIGLSGEGIVDYSDRITMRFSAKRDSPSQNKWTLRFEIINQDTNTTVVDLVETDTVAANSIQNGTAFWNNREGLPWPDLQIRQAGLSIDFSDRPLSEQTLYASIIDSDKDGLTDQFETLHNLAVYDPDDGSVDSDGDGLDNQTEQLFGTNPKLADSDGDNINDAWELLYGSDPNNGDSQPFGFTQLPESSYEDFDGNGLSDVWEFVARSLPPDGDEDLDGFKNLKETDWGTDPWDPLSTPEFSITANDETIQIRWPELLYKNFNFEQSSNLKSWTPLTGTSTGNYRIAELDVSEQSTPNSFFKLNVKGDLPNGLGDTDGDGIGLWAENLFGLSLIDRNSGRTSAWVDSTGNGTPDTEVSGDRLQLMALINDGLDGSDISDLHASRFLSQATFGPTTEQINYLRLIGFEAWLDEQIETIPPTHLTDVILGFYDDYHGPRVRNDYRFFDNDQELPMDNLRTAFGKAAINGPDQLRQRVAFALSQILVISGRDTNLDRMPVSVATYYDTLIDNAFGNYRDILEYATFNACMGLYLSHVGNQRAQPELNIFPDENYARELMQLFTIGLWELNPDGTRQLDAQGEPIPSYGQTEITELARVMTGFWFAGRKFSEGGWTDRIGMKPMEMHASRHDFSKKAIVGGRIIPSREPSKENAYQDVKDAIRIVFEHPNTPIFVSKQLIQFLVTDNPSPAYVERVQNVFVDNGNGERGDLEAVVRAILMDSEARSSIHFANKRTTGSLKQPVIRIMQLARVFKVANKSDFHMWQLDELEEEFNQDPLNAPSVFNYFKPQYAPAGILGDEGLVGPVFQILHSYSSISGPKQIWTYLQRGFSTRWDDDASQPFDYSEFIPLESNSKALLERINTLFCQGMMSSGSRSAILEAIGKLDNLKDLPPGIRTQVAVWIAVCGASGATQL